MDKSGLARLMLEFEEVSSVLESLRADIETQVLELGSTVVTGNVRATYSGGRRQLDWEAAVSKSDATEAEVAEHTIIIPEEIIPSYTETDWAGLAKELKIEPVVVAEGTPSVKVKIE